MKTKASTDTLELNPHVSEYLLMNRLTTRQSHSVYKTALFFNDWLLSVFSYLGCAILFGEGINIIYNISHLLAITIFVLASIAFFRSSKLYNYHIIYDASRHVRQLVMAWGWNMLILISAFLIHTYGQSVTDFQFVVGTAAIAMLFLLLIKYIDEYAVHVLAAVGISFIVVGWLELLGPESTGAITAAPLALVSGFFLTVITVSLSRYLIVHQLFSKVMKKKFRRQTVIIGSDEQAESITKYIIDNNTPFWITGVVGMPSEFGKKLRVTKGNLGEVINLPRIMEENSVSEVIITDEKIDKKTLIAILDYCAANRVNIWFPPNYMPIISVKLYIDHFCGLPMIRLCTQKNIRLFSKLKYSLDAFATLPIFLIQLPVFMAIAIAVKFTSSGPVFYKATAIGKSGRAFSMFKFRSMQQNSDSSIHKQYVTKLIKGQIKNEDGNRKVLKLTNDNRITPIGKIIRKYSLDELPQLINVLKGDMSLIGPRPCLPYEYEAYEEWHKKRVAVRPGISGLWQVTGRSEVSFEDMILLDLYYIYNQSFSLDLSILFETLFVVMNKKGAY
jgi:exopolysaccharide biosynthesis polyprenyl glycosylphosphotransferase